MSNGTDGNNALRMWARTHMRGAYLQVMSSIIGVGNYSMQDSSFLDQLDARVDTLLGQRAELENVMASAAGNHTGQDTVEAAASTAGTGPAAVETAVETPQPELSTGDTDSVTGAVSDAEREAAEQAAVAAAASQTQPVDSPTA